MSFPLRRRSNLQELFSGKVNIRRISIAPTEVRIANISLGMGLSKKNAY
jgi:hypothetical protein